MPDSGQGERMKTKQVEIESEIEVGEVYEDESGNAYEVSGINSRHIHVTPLDEQLRFTHSEFNELFLQADEEEEE
jgi:hypothetical protein